LTTAPMKKTTLRASDFNCPSCVSKIEKSLAGLAGVKSAEVHFNTGRIAVEHDPSKSSAQDLVKAVANAGYTAKVSAF